MTLFINYKYVGSSKVSLARLCLGHKIFQRDEIPTLNFQINSQKVFWGGWEGKSHRENLLSTCENATFHLGFYTILQTSLIGILVWHAVLTGQHFSIPEQSYLMFSFML